MSGILHCSILTWTCSDTVRWRGSRGLRIFVSRLTGSDEESDYQDDWDTHDSRLDVGREEQDRRFMVRRNNAGSKYEQSVKNVTSVDIVVSWCSAYLCSESWRRCRSRSTLGKISKENRRSYWMIYRKNWRREGKMNWRVIFVKSDESDDEGVLIVV